MCITFHFDIISTFIGTLVLKLLFLSKTTKAFLRCLLLNINYEYKLQIITDTFTFWTGVDKLSKFAIAFPFSRFL